MQLFTLGQMIPASALIVALVEVIKSHVPTVDGWVTILVATLLGLGAGLLGLGGLDPLTGTEVGLAAAGVHQVASTAGGK